MNEKSPVMDQAVTFGRSSVLSFRSLHLPSLPIVILIIVVAFLVVTPLFLMVLNSFQTARPGQPIVWGMEGWVKAFSTPGIIKAMTNALTLAITRQTIALFIGSFFAWLIARTDIPMKGMLEFFFWLSFFLPALPETMGWILLLDPKYGLLNQGLMNLGVVSQPLFNIYSFGGIVWAHMGGTVSVKVMLLAPAFRNLDAAFEEASKISGASGRHTFFHIVIPVMMPAILVTTILGIIRSLEAFEIELLLGTPIGLQVYSTKIHELVTWEPPQFAPAMALSTVFLGVLLVMVALQRRYIANRNYETITGRGFSIRPTRLGRWRYPAFALVLFFALVVTLVPTALLLIAMVIKSMPFGTQMIKSVLIQLGSDLEEASKVCGGTWFHTFRRVILPLTMPALITVGLVGFISAARDISTVVLLGSGKSRTLSLLMLDFAAGAEFEKATVVAVIIVGLVVGAALFARAIGGQVGVRE